MTRRLRMAELTIRRYDDGTSSADIRVDSQLLPSFLLELFLLRESLIDDLVCHNDNGQALSLRASQESGFSQGTYASSEASLTLSSRDLEFISSFLLKYYRDGVAEVTHIDISIHRPGSSSEEGVLIIEAADWRAGMTGDEARRILGIG